jgi:hypothetical protein
MVDSAIRNSSHIESLSSRLEYMLLLLQEFKVTYMKRIALLFTGLLVVAAVIVWMTVIQNHPVPTDTVDSINYETARYAVKIFDK